MPELCRFYGIVIRMYPLDHAPPHFHADYSGYEALVEIDNLTVIRGRLAAQWGQQLAEARRLDAAIEANLAKLGFGGGE